MQIRTRVVNEDARVDLERLLVGRGRLRVTGNDAARKRMDLPTALVSPDMWVDTSSPWGGCIFGRFAGGMVSQSYVGAAAMIDLTFQEMA
jgi:hypothetical protein